jgi:hypothetical protein
MTPISKQCATNRYGPTFPISVTGKSDGREFCASESINTGPAESAGHEGKIKR